MENRNQTGHPSNIINASLGNDHNYAQVQDDNQIQHQQSTDCNGKNTQLDDSGDNDTWQIVSGSGKKRNLSNGINPQLKKYRQNNSEGLKTNNSHDVLSDTEDMDDTTFETVAHEPKPPPIFIPDVANVKIMVSTIESVISNTDYTYKCLPQNKIKICPTTVDAYRKLVHKFSNTKINFHTFQLKQDRAYRVVLKNMHFSTDLDDLKKSIEEYGYSVRSASNMRHFQTKQPMSMFFVDLEPHPNNKDIFNVEYLLNAKIVFEPPKRKPEVVQCKRCQSYGHTKTYCWHRYRCVKCGQQHDTSTCTKTKDIPPTCALCNGNHPANYKGCNVYKSIKNKSFPPLRPKMINKPTQSTEDELPSENQRERNSSRSSIYAQAAATKPGTDQSGNTDQAMFIQTMQSFFEKFEKMMLQQAQQIGSLMNLLTTVISKLK